MSRVSIFFLTPLLQLNTLFEILKNLTPPSHVVIHYYLLLFFFNAPRLVFSCWVGLPLNFFDSSFVRTIWLFLFWQ